MKKVLILSGSPRKGGNSDVLCDEFARGALDAGNEVEKIRVVEKKISPCTGCYYCKTSGGRCAFNAILSPQILPNNYLSKFTIAAKSGAFKDAPPIKPPSISSIAINSLQLPAFMLPPY